MRTIIGDSSTYQGLTLVGVEPKLNESVVVNNVAGSTLNYYSNTCSAPAGTIAAAANQTFTLPVWLQSQGRTAIQLTGGKYGAV
jgi:hypothetical protein